MSGAFVFLARQSELHFSSPELCVLLMPSDREASREDDPFPFVSSRFKVYECIR